MHVWLTNLFSMANAPQYFLHRFLPFCALLLIHLHSLPLSTLFIPPVCACPSVKCEFTRKMNWNRLQIHILRRYGWLLYVHFICFFCPAKGYVNNKSKCLWVRSVAERERERSDRPRIAIDAYAIVAATNNNSHNNENKSQQIQIPNCNNNK